MRQPALLLVLVTCFFLSVFVAIEAEAQGIRVTPARIEAVLGGEGLLPPVYVQNRSSEPVVLLVETGWGAHDIHGSPIYLKREEQTEIGLFVEPKESLLLPGATLSLTLRVDPADRAAYPMLYLQLLRPNAPEAEKTRIAVPLLLHTGHEERRVRIEDVRLLPADDGRALLQAVVLNEGNAHIRTEGSVRLLREDDSVAMEVALPEVVVLPGARRLLSADWPTSALPWGEYRLVLDTQDRSELLTPIRFAVGPEGLKYAEPEAAEQLATGVPWL